MKMLIIIHVLLAILLYVCSATFIYTETTNAIKELNATKLTNSFWRVVLRNLHFIPLFLVPIINFYSYYVVLTTTKKAVYEKILKLKKESEYNAG